MNGIVQFRKCTLTDKQLAKKVDNLTDEIYKTGKIPSRMIPARPDEDYDLLVGELIVRFLERIKKDEQVEQGPERVSVNAVVMGEQYLIRATVWYMKHKEHVTSVVSETEQKYPPSDEYDVRNPNVWKPQHWRWFIEKYL